MAKESSAKKKETGTELALHNAALEIPDEQIPDTIEGVADWIVENEKGVRKVALVYWWNIGKMIATIQANEGKYGSKAVDQVAEKSGKSDRLLYHAHNFYKDHPDFQKVGKMAIEWSAAREIQRVPDVKARLQLEARAEEENLTVREVKEEVNKAKGKPEGKKEPSKPTGPNALGYFQKMVKELEKMTKMADGFLKDLPAMLEMVSDEERTPDEDYNLIVEGDEKKDALAVSAAKKGASLVEKLNRFVVPLKDTFNEDTGSEDSEEEA